MWLKMSTLTSIPVADGFEMMKQNAKRAISSSILMLYAKEFCNYAQVLPQLLDVRRKRVVLIESSFSPSIMHDVSSHGYLSLWLDHQD